MWRVLRIAMLAGLAFFGGSAFAQSTADAPGDGEDLVPPLAEDVAPDAEPVTDADEIKRILDNLTIYGRYVDGENWIEYHMPDGTTAYWENGCTYPGRWWMERGQICYAYPNYNEGAPNCFLLLRRAKGAIQFVAVDQDGIGYLASFSLKTALGNDAHLPTAGLSPCVGV